MDNIPENTNHINHRKNEIINNIINGFVKSQDEDTHEEGPKEEEKTEGALPSEQKQLIKQYIISHPHLDDEDFHKYAMKMGINKHEAEEAVYQMFNEVYNQDRLKELEGGAADNMTADDIAKKHNITLQELQKQINIGLKVEREHTKNEKQALEITLDHLCENAKYYTEAKPENWAEKEIEAEKAIIGELDMLNKALPPTEGEIREYKDGKYRFEGGHWKKIKQEEKYHNKEEVVKKIKLTGYKGKTFFVRTANSFKFEDQVRGFLTPIFKEKYPDLEEDVLHDKIGRLFESGYLDKFKESKQITEGDLSDIIKEYEDYDNMTATSYELNQVAESAVKSGISTPKERELVKKKLEEEKPKVEEKKEPEKPVAKVIGEDGNVFNLIGICMKALKRAGQPEKAKEMQEKIFAAGSYEEALNIMGEYCDLQ